MVATEITGSGLYLARLGEGSHHMGRLMRLESLRANTTEANLNRHLLRVHLPTPQVIELTGLQYDAELAAFLGISLQETADEAMEVITAISEGSLGKTKTFPRMAEIHKMIRPAEPPLEADVYAAQIEAKSQYTERLKAELKTLAKLGVASVDQFDTSMNPVVGDQFFEVYGIEEI